MRARAFAIPLPCSGEAGAFAVVPNLIKRYGRSRLYDTAEGRYVTVDLRQWLRDGIAFWVQDVETGEDVTRVLLA